MNQKKRNNLVQLALTFGILVFVNIIGNYLYTWFDLTEEKRFTLTRPTREIVRNVPDIVYINVLLEGEFPAGFKRLQSSVRELLREFRSINSKIEFNFEDPAQGTVEEINARRTALAEQGIAPVNLRLIDNDARTEKLIYPVAVVRYGTRSIVINLLENEVAGASPDENLNNSVNLLEYKFANALHKLQIVRKPAVMFTEGHGELDTLETMDLENTLGGYYRTGRINLDSVVRIDPEVGLLIIAKPATAFSERDKFKVDQYVMQGGRVLFLIDKLGLGLDSLRNRSSYVPLDLELNLDDLFFKYGLRLNPELILDLECSRIPLTIGQLGNRPQVELFPWFYYPTVTPEQGHPIGKNVGRVNLFFPVTIDTIKTKTDIRKTPLLRSSQYTRTQIVPVQLNFEILRYEPDPTKFNKGHKNIALLLEGSFPSLYENRLSEEMQQGLEEMKIPFRASSEPTRMIVVSDGDLARNPVNRASGQFNTLGFNTFENFKYANKDFMLNAIEYLLDEEGVLEARNREVRLRLLDTVRANTERTQWQLINIGLPLFLLAVFGVLYQWWRKRRYAR